MRNKPDQLEEKLLASLGAERLARFILDRACNDPQLYEAAVRMIQYNSEPTSVYSEIIGRIKALTSSKRFYHRRAAGDLDYEVSDIVRSIREDLSPVSPEEAIAALQFLVERDAKIIESVDTSDGTVYPHLQAAVALLGELWGKHVGIDRSRIAQYVFARLSNNGYAVFDYVIENFSAALGSCGLKRLEQLLREAISREEESFKKRGLIADLKQIADLQRDVDKFIALSHEFPSPHKDYDRLQCAKRLAQIGRVKEALTLMERIDRNVMAWRSDIDATLLSCFEQVGKKDEVRQILERQFLELPTSDSLKRILDATAPGEDPREHYVDLALARATSQYQLIDFLVEIKDEKRLAALVLGKSSSWDGGHYYSLSPAAQLLERSHPLAATILYRALIDNVLARGQSRYYHHAAKYLARLDALAVRLADYGAELSHDQYLALLRNEHKRKSAFWLLVGDRS